MQMILCSMIAAVSLQFLLALAGPPRSTEISSILHLQNGLNSASQTIFVINVFLTDLLFLCRCYLIYSRQWKVIVLPGLLISITIVSAIVSLGTGSQSTLLLKKVHLITAVGGYAMGLITNIVLMTLTAGRLWWMARNSTHAHLPTAFKSRYNTTISIILESGTIYCVCAALLAVSLMSTGSNGKFYLTMEGIAFQAVNIAPTLTVVRVGLGHNVLDSMGGGISPGPAAWKGHNLKALECGRIEG
ncbi:hypothetical protein C8R45DRAFT_972911 [Mycena sanguinolenta]|nr:hypothetical protein C8R45DRAFT_972911 [Mycena sanguinolenta]